jgi:siroheme synthase-like protein
MARMSYYPLFMELAGRPCLVVGAGAVAARKTRSLLECGARVTVVGETPVAAFRALERRGAVVERRRFRGSDVGRQALVIAATDDCAVNAAVAAAARRRGIPVNAVDDPPNCTFIVPAVLRRGDLTVAISTGGKSPAAARLVKERIAALLGDEYAALVKLLGAHRGRMKDAVAGQGSRARAWQRMIDGGVLESLRAGDAKAAKATVRRCLTAAAVPPPRSRRARPTSGQRRGGAEGRSPAARSSERAPQAAAPKARPRCSGSRSDRKPNEIPSPPSIRPSTGVAAKGSSRRRSAATGPRSGYGNSDGS